MWFQHMLSFGKFNGALWSQGWLRKSRKPRTCMADSSRNWCHTDWGSAHGGSTGDFRWTHCALQNRCLFEDCKLQSAYAQSWVGHIYHHSAIWHFFPLCPIPGHQKGSNVAFSVNMRNPADSLRDGKSNLTPVCLHAVSFTNQWII